MPNFMVHGGGRGGLRLPYNRGGFVVIGLRGPGGVGFFFFDQNLRIPATTPVVTRKCSSLFYLNFTLFLILVRNSVLTNCIFNR